MSYPRLFAEVMEHTGLAWPESWDDAWMCIKRVWASKWNRSALGAAARQGRVRNDDLYMAVLIQQVIEAEYAFVIHTVNPSTGNPDELYAEVVLGLGETLVGNYPGRALSFVCNRKSMRPELLSFPSKTLGLYGSGLIFRSDSNGEDLPGYAGAGLHDSIVLKPPREVVLDYSRERARVGRRISARSCCSRSQGSASRLPTPPTLPRILRAPSPAARTMLYKRAPRRSNPEA